MPILWQQAASPQGPARLSGRENCCLAPNPIKTWMYKVKNKPRTSLFRLIVIWLAFKSHTQYIWNSCNASISWAFQHFNQSIFQNKEAGMSNSNHPLNSSNPLHYTKFKASLMDNLPHRETRAHADAQPQEAGRHFGRWQTPMGGGKQADSWTCTESPKSAETQSPLWWQPPCYARHKCIAVFSWNNAKKLAQHTLQGNASPPSFQVYLRYFQVYFQVYQILGSQFLQGHFWRGRDPQLSQT